MAGLVKVGIASAVVMIVCVVVVVVGVAGKNNREKLN
jgi:hypothetical protein